MKLHAITFAAALFAAHLATAQVEQPMVGTVTDTVSSTVILGSDVDGNELKDYIKNKRLH